jgi:uncharacterized protein (TIGR02996 family)
MDDAAVLQAFLDDIVAHSKDASLWLILSDWLTERDDPRADLVRLTWQLQHEREHRDFSKRQARVQALLATGMIPVVPRRRTPLDFEFVWISPGSFLMGSPPVEERRGSNEKQHPVTISRGFWLGVTAVTQGQWTKIKRSNPSAFSRNGQYSGDVRNFSDEDLRRFPVERVSWRDAHTFLERLGKRLDLRFRLPTEAEWEYACRAGTTSTFHFGSVLDGSQANCDAIQAYGTKRRGKYLSRTQPTGSYPPNAWGLYDMHGNVWEWCQDTYQEDYEKLPAIDPLAEDPQATLRCQRGGCGILHAWSSRAACRRGIDPGSRALTNGLRLVLCD